MFFGKAATASSLHRHPMRSTGIVLLLMAVTLAVVNMVSPDMSSTGIRLAMAGLRTVKAAARNAVIAGRDANLGGILASTDIAVGGAAAPVLSDHPRMILDGATLSVLRQRAAADTSEWRALKSSCDSLIGGNVNYPAQATYPNPPNLGQGYQGSSYLPALMDEALCYQVLRSSNPKAAATYGAKAVDILMKMSTPHTPGGQGENPLADDGYVIRFYGVGFGLGYDWLYDLLTPAQRIQVYTTANTWLTAFEKPGSVADFEYKHPQGNYFAGYFHAKATIALGTYGDNPAAPAQWTDWLNNQFGRRVQPYYAQHLSGGGWPEGFGNYAPLAVFNMSMPVREVKTATGIDLVHATAPYSYPLDSADYIMHFTWPSRAYFDDRDTNHSGGTATHPPGTAPVGIFQQVLGELSFWDSPRVGVFHQYLDEVASATSGESAADPWVRFLELDPDAAKSSLKSLPLSYLASGMGAVAARSDWTTKASWMSFRAGPYINNPGAGEEYFDQGSLALVRGSSPLLVNAGGWVVHDPNGTADETHVYNDNFGDGKTLLLGSRQLYNVFYVRNMRGSSLLDRFGQAAYTTEDDHVRTGIAAYEDGVDHVYVLATHLEDMYRKFPAGVAVADWSRQIVYLRPNRFVVYDRTRAGSAGYDQYMAWHFPASPVAAAAAGGQKRLDVSYDGKYVGAMTTVLPANAELATLPLYPDSKPVKAWQVQVRPAGPAISHQWLTVFDMSSSAASVATASTVAVIHGTITGVRLAASDGNNVVISSSGPAATPLDGTIAYAVPASMCRHLITDLAAATGYNITVSTSGDLQTINVSSGGSHMSSAKGVLDFVVSADGTVQPAMSNRPHSAEPAGGAAQTPGS